MHVQCTVHRIDTLMAKVKLNIFVDKIMKIMISVIFIRDEKIVVMKLNAIQFNGWIIKNGKAQLKGDVIATPPSNSEGRISPEC